MKANIFREYDIRGEYPNDIDENGAYIIGKSYGSYLQEFKKINKCLVGYDNRLSSPILKEHLIKGILDSGCAVGDCGLITTPMLYWARNEYQLPGIMITASHNPKDDNGFKFSFDNYANARGGDIINFKNYTLASNFKNGEGVRTSEDVVKPYLDFLFNSVNLEKKLKVIIDCGNGTVSQFVKEVHSHFNLDVEYLYSESDGNFPNHHPDPSVEENLVVLKERVLETKADLGLSYDGDGDRLGIVDEQGKFVPADYVMIAIVKDIITNAQNKTILQDVKCSKALEDEVIKHGGTPYIYRTGASYTQAEVYEKNIVFGGEYSGHLYFNDRVFPSSCGMYAGLRILEILSKTNKTFSQLLADVNVYHNYPEERFSCSDDTKFDVIDKIKDYCQEKSYKIVDIDGVRVNFEDGWALVRASNTGPNITTRFEALSKERLEQIRNEFINVLKSYLN